MCCAIKISNRNIKVAEYVKRFSSKSRITEGDVTEELLLIKAPSRNRAVYPCPSGQAGIGGAFFGVPFWASKKVQSHFFRKFLVLSEFSIIQYLPIS